MQKANEIRTESRIFVGRRECVDNIGGGMFQRSHDDDLRIAVLRRAGGAATAESPIDVESIHGRASLG